MAAAELSAALILDGGRATAIAELSPELANTDLRTVRGEVTIVWPYNSVKKSIAFLLAEPDVRLRRAKGQVRVQLQGPSAKAIVEAGVGAGDELTLSLEGVEWTKDTSPGQIPGARVEWQLQFGELFEAQVKLAESQETKTININHPAPEQPSEPPAPSLPAPESHPPPTEGFEAIQTIGLNGASTPVPVRKAPEDFAAGEFASPAFIKRARSSYGALLDRPSDSLFAYDIFEDDGGVRGRGRKRMKFGRESLRPESPSPEPEELVQEDVNEDLNYHDAVQLTTPSKPQMADEGSQTMDFEPTLSTPVPPLPIMSDLHVELEQDEQPNEALLSHKSPLPPRLSPEVALRQIAHTVQPVSDTRLGGLELPTQSTAEAEQEVVTHQAVDSSSRREIQALPLENPSTQFEALSGPPETPIASSPLQNKTKYPSGFSMFGNTATSPVEYSAPKFGGVMSTPLDDSLGISEQVRFGFSHIPQTEFAAPDPADGKSPPSAYDHPEDYPASYLDRNAPVKYADMQSYVNAAEQEHETEPGYQYQLEHPPPEAQSFQREQWEITAQSISYDATEGGHYGADALIEGNGPVGAELRSDDVPAQKVSAGFSSYGRGEAEVVSLVSEDEEESVEDGSEAGSDQEQESPKVREPDPDFIDNEDVVDEDYDQNAVDHDEGSAYDENGEEADDGDYDQVNNEDFADDDSGLSDEQDEAVTEERARYPNEAGYFERNEDDYSEEDEEGYDDEGEYDEEEDDWDNGSQMPRRTVPSTQASFKQGEVIDLLSSSDEEEDAEDDEDEGEDDDTKGVPAPLPTISAAHPPNQESPSQQPLAVVHSEPEAELGIGQPTLGDSAPAAAQDRSEPFVPSDTQEDSIAAHAAKEAPATAANTEPVSEVVVLSSSAPPSPRRADMGESQASHEEVRAAEQSGDHDVHMKDADADSLADEFHSDVDAEGDDLDAVDEHHEDAESHVEDIAEPRDQGEESLGDQEEDQAEASEEIIEPPAAEDVVEVSDEVMLVEPLVPDTEPDLEEASETQISAAKEETERGDDNATKLLSGQEQINETAVPSSPPLTQSFDTQIQDNDSPSALLPDIAPEENLEQMPTPLEIQPLDQIVQQPSSSAGNIISPRAFNEPVEADDIPDLSSSQDLIQASEEEVVVPDSPQIQEKQPGVDVAAEVEDESTVAMQVDSAAPEDVNMEDWANEPGSPSQQLNFEDAESLSRNAEHDIQALPTEEQNVHHVDLGQEKPIGDADMQDLEHPLDPEQHDVPAVADAAAEQAEGGTVIEESPAPATRRTTRSSRLSHEPTQNGHKQSADEQITTQPTEKDLDMDKPPSANTRARASSPDPSIQLARAANAAKRGKKLPEPVPPSPMMTRARSNSVQIRATPESEDPSLQLAKAAALSPTKVSSDGNQASGTSSKELITRLRTDMAECVPLNSLPSHLNKPKLTVVAVATKEPAEPLRAKKGPRQYMMSFNITDPSIAPGRVVEVQLYRAHKTALPNVKPGEAVLLRDFKVVSLKGRDFGLRSHDDSAWAVFDASGGRPLEEDTHGPPIEVEDNELAYMGPLTAWYGSLDTKAKGRLEEANRKFSEAAGGK